MVLIAVTVSFVGSSCLVDRSLLKHSIRFRPNLRDQIPTMRSNFHIAVMVFYILCIHNEVHHLHPRYLHQKNGHYARHISSVDMIDLAYYLECIVIQGLEVALFT